MGIGPEEVVVEAIQEHPRLDLEGRCQPAGDILPLDQDHLVTLLRQAQRHGQAQCSPAEDRGAGQASRNGSTESTKARGASIIGACATPGMITRRAPAISASRCLAMSTMSG